MSFPEYGRLVSESPQSFEEFGEIVQIPSRARSLVNAPLKGFAKGAKSALEFVGVLPGGPIDIVRPLGFKGTKQDVRNYIQKGQEFSERGAKAIERALPTHQKGPEEFLERAGELGSFLIGGEASIPSKIIRSLGGAAVGQGLKAVGAPKIAQDVGEIATLSLPDLAKKIPAKLSQRESVNFLRKKGLSEEQIAPLIQSKQKINLLSPIAAKGKKTEKVFADLKDKFGHLYEDIRSRASKLPGLNYEQTDAFLDAFQKKMDKIPKRFRRLIGDSVDDLLNSRIDFNALQDFYKDINAVIRGTEGGKEVLGILKEPIREAQKVISPELAAEFDLTNQLYSRGRNLSKVLKPDQIESLVQKGEIYALAAAIANRSFPLLKKLLGVVGGRKLAQELLINPRLQNLSNRMLEAIKKNKIPESMKLMEIFKEESGLSEPSSEK